MKIKGQAAMEYLMTYGWAIIIIIVAIAALYAMGVFSAPTTIVPPSFGYFAYVDYADGTLLIRNGPQQVTITAVTGATLTVPVTFDPGKDITLTGISTTGDVDITITYDVVGGLAGHTDSATIRQ